MQFLLLHWVQVLALASSVIVAVLSWKRSQANQFYSDTFFLWPWGVFVWGDGLILGPFWTLIFAVSLVLPDFTWTLFARWYSLFFAVRFAYETVYWINHQVAQKDYIPPFIRRIKWLKAQEAGILYQLLTMCGAIVSLMIWMSLS